MNTPCVWEVKDGQLLIWRGQERVADIPLDLFPALILTLAEALKNDNTKRH